jgi:tetratricopeptide (TPR) repeat protein
MIATIASLALTLWLVALPAHPSLDEPPQAKSTPKDDPLVDARKATDREDWDEAAAKFRAFLDGHPNAPEAPEARFWAGFCLVKLGEHEEAVEVLNPFTDDRRAEFLTALGQLSGDMKAPVVVRVSARDRRTQALSDDEHPEEAEAMLREALAAETAEFPRCRAAMKLADILADELDKPDEAVKLLDQLRTNLKRRDLSNELREASDRIRKQAESGEKE